MATIHDVAALAGVSTSSVSNVLNGRTEKLSAATYSRVEEAIRTLGMQTPPKAPKAEATEPAANE